MSLLNGFLSKPVARTLGAAFGLLAVLLIIALGRPSLFPHADTTACGPISADTTWTSAGNDFVVTCDVQINSGITLTIQAGVVVKFDVDTSFQVDGTLIAHACTFTSNASTPAPGDWGRIYFTPNSVDAVLDANGSYVSGSMIEDCLIEWGGGGTNVSGAVETNLASPFIVRNTIRNSASSGIHALGRSIAQPIVIQGNSISNNGTLTVDGAGVHVSTGNVISNTISSNEGYKGGGINASASMILSNTVSSNRVNNAGAGIYASGSTLRGNVISGNTPVVHTQGGGIYASSSVIIDNIIDGNSASTSGGGIYAVGVSTITANAVHNNSAVLYDGGGIWVNGGTVQENSISSNSSPQKGGGIYAQNTTVRGNTVEANSAMSGGGIYGQDANLTNNSLSGNNASNNGGGIYAYRETSVLDNNITDNSAAQGGGVYATNLSTNQPNLVRNTLRNNEANFGGGVYAIQSNVRGNTVLSNTAHSDGGGIFADSSAVTNNGITGNSVPISGRGSGAYLVNVSELSGNDISSNTAPGGTAGGISLEGGSDIQYNNLYGNQPYDAEVISADLVTATLNYWGPSACTAIPDQIYDGNDAPGRGTLVFAPSLYESAPLSQLSAPTSLTLITDTSSATLNWLAIPPIPNVGCRIPGSSGPDAGYRVFYSVDSPCPPFDGQGLDQGDSPIDVGSDTSFTLTGLGENGYYFTVSAWDFLGRESSFSNVVATVSDQKRIYLPLALRNS